MEEFYFWMDVNLILQKSNSSLSGVSVIFAGKVCVGVCVNLIFAVMRSEFGVVRAVVFAVCVGGWVLT